MTQRHTAVGIGLLTLLACGAALRAQDLTPAPGMIIPEAIWADASGGGTWVTELQITVKASGTTVVAGFIFGDGLLARRVDLATTTADYQTLYYPNILAAMQSLDPTFTYKGRVGTLVIGDSAFTSPVWVQAMTVNGDYGKTMPGIGLLDSMTANVGRDMVIPNLRQSATYRTFVGCINGSYPPAAMTVTFRLMDPSGFVELASFTKTFAPSDFKAFNPFAEAGLGAAEIPHCWLLIHPVSCTSTGEGSFGLASFGSIANNSTNDTYALIAIPFR